MHIRIKMIDVCIALHDKYGNYSKNAAVLLCSIFTKTKSFVCVHILHDSTITPFTRKRFVDLCDRYNQKVEFYQLSEVDFLDVEFMTREFTIGSLYRLKIPDILSQEVKKVIYLDADIIVDMDIIELWNIDISDYLCAAAEDPFLKKGVEDFERVFEKRIDFYLNSGVLLLNLDRIREIFNNNSTLWEKSVDFLKQHIEARYPDQDALNFLFCNKIFQLDKRYNLRSSLLRKKKYTIMPCIYHIAGDFIHFVSSEYFDNLYWQYMSSSGWCNREVEHYYRIEQCIKNNSIFKAIVSKPGVKKIYWGADSLYTDKVLEIIPANVDVDYFVDSNRDLLYKKKSCMTIYGVERLFQEDKTKVIVIVISGKFYEQIKKYLEECGFKEYINVFNGVVLLKETALTVF